MKEQEYTVQFSAGETYGIITSKLPLARPRVCKAHAPVLAHRVLRTLNHAKPQQCGFVEAALRRHGITKNTPHTDVCGVQLFAIRQRG